MVLAGYLLKAQCLAPWDDNLQYRRLCYNDIQPLYGIRGFEQHTFPYIHGDLVDGQPVNGALEYPVGTGLFMWVAGSFVDDFNSFLKVNALMLAPVAILIAYLLFRIGGHRAMLWAGAPALVLYAFHNWDLLAVAAAVGGFYMWWRGAPLWAAVMFGIGGAFKAYPLIFLAPLALHRWRSSSGADATKAALAGAGTFVAINLPFALINFDGWWATYAFHSQRTANFDSIWWLRWPNWSVPTVNGVTTSLILLAFATILVWGHIRSRSSEEGYPFLQVSAAMLAAFMLFNKVHSPQYTLWLIPFFVLLNVRVGWWVAYAAVDALVYVSVFRFYYDYSQSMKGALVLGVWSRAFLLAALIPVFMRARAASPEVGATDGGGEPPPVTTTTVGAAKG